MYLTVLHRIWRWAWWRRCLRSDWRRCGELRRSASRRTRSCAYCRTSSSRSAMTDVSHLDACTLLSIGVSLNAYSNLGVLTVVTWQVLFISVPVIVLAIRLQKGAWSSLLREAPRTWRALVNGDHVKRAFGCVIEGGALPGAGCGG